MYDWCHVQVAVFLCLNTKLESEQKIIAFLNFGHTITYSWNLSSAFWWSGGHVYASSSLEDATTKNFNEKLSLKFQRDPP